MRSRIKRVREVLEALRCALLVPYPEELNRTLPRLEEAVRDLYDVEKELRFGAADTGIAAELKLLKNDLRTVLRLIEQGAAFYQIWARMLGAATAGYTQAGEPAPLDQIASVTGGVSLRG